MLLIEIGWANSGFRNLSDYDGGEKEMCPNGSFYLEDGNHRALIYAMYVKLGKVEVQPC